MAKRKTVTITVDSEIWELSAIILPCSRSAFIEDQLREYINSSNDIEKLKEEIAKDKQAVKLKEEKLEGLERIRERNNSNEKIISAAMNTVHNIVFKHNGISRQQIRNIAKINLIDPKVLEDKIKKEDIKILNFTPDS